MQVPAYLAQKFPEIGEHWPELQPLFIRKHVASGFSIESFEDTDVLMLSKRDFTRIQQQYPSIEPAITRFIAYRNIFFNHVILR